MVGGVGGGVLVRFREEAGVGLVVGHLVGRTRGLCVEGAERGLNGVGVL